MVCPNVERLEWLRQQRMDDSLRRAEQRQLCRDAGIESQSRLHRRLSRPVEGLGGLLVRMGQRLQGYGAPAPATHQLSAARK